MSDRRRKRVLVMDDSGLALEILARALEASGFEVAQARSLADLDKLAPESVDLVLMDVDMPEAFGDDVAGYLRDARGLGAPVLLVSNRSEEELAKRTRDAGMDGYLLKQRGADAVVARVREALGDSELWAAVDQDDLVTELVSTARGRLRRAESAVKRNEPAAAAAELHTLSGEASLLGCNALAASVTAYREAILRGVESNALELAVALAALEADLGALARAAMLPRAPADRSTGRVLLLDDSDLYRSTLLALLEDAGYEVVEARRLSEARHRIHEGRYDLAILDLQLEDGAGPDLIPELRKAAKETRLLVLSGEPGVVADADLVLDKSLDTGELLRRIDELVKRR
jgi:DNA-binding response OmpR family regulator